MNLYVTIYIASVLIWGILVIIDRAKTRGSYGFTFMTVIISLAIAPISLIMFALVSLEKYVTKKLSGVGEDE